MNVLPMSMSVYTCVPGAWRDQDMESGTLKLKLEGTDVMSSGSAKGTQAHQNSGHCS